MGHGHSELPSVDQVRDRAGDALARCGVTLRSSLQEGSDSVALLTVRTPINGAVVAEIPAVSVSDVQAAVAAATEAFIDWRVTPAPARGEVVRRFGENLREHKNDLAELVTLEAGKIESEARGEVQEMIDVCDFAVGLSRQLYGLTMASERPGHRLMETWHPLGVTAVITAFNFPVAVWAWNTAIALVCGNPVVWKPSEQTPLTALACDSLLKKAFAETRTDPRLHSVLPGGRAVGEALIDDTRTALVSATGSVRMGREVAPRVAARFGKTLLELGGNNGAIVAPTADIDLAVRGIVFAAAGTAGQRCTTLRRLIVHESIADEVTERVAKAYSTLRIGNPFSSGVLVGPLIGGNSYDAMTAALQQAQSSGGEVLCGGERHYAEEAPDAYYVSPALVRMPGQAPIVHEETFAPILYVMTYTEFDEAIALHNAVPQGLASAVFTNDVREAETFLSAAGSDCGISNVNIGTSGAEIGGAFGGEKHTGGGRESGSDAWKAYMRRATNTINYSRELPLAQGVEFG
ncbi:L-piperidine-6-carboxylate dehydrogenase [Hoyosella subflava]|uniref:Aldehyde dehydrogenase (NAD+) n=1 Tax=Hoyosella subflava (strain DSM 45089 / JCM 17490 / NBRC 109087 / DQS3-9A1) TaxID=443218 RepID=F6EP03_HOYSD|nr:aldehyde dehydrogenase family protein [Hoyosella subflava]AEF40469.1 Aldehyde dehydrogenase (NAD+) [Hoyosella subflava DQS3-9A1]